MELYTILGAGGVIANDLAQELLENGKKVRLVSRKPVSVHGITDLMAADIIDPLHTRRAVSGSSTVFLCAGLAYNHKIWEAAWPKIIQNVIHACSEAGIPLIFFDNVYMYGRVDGVMTENTPYNPVSKKGEVRALIAGKVMDRVKEGRLTACIARSADFYGPGADKSGILNLLAINNVARGKMGSWLGNDEVPHSYTYTKDAAKGLFMLSQDSTAFNQIWHLPTTNPSLTGREYMDLIGEIAAVKPKYMRMRGWMLKMGGLFDSTIGELHEMLYQNDYPYIFDSTKFEKKYNFEPTSYSQGIIESVIAISKKYGIPV